MIPFEEEASLNSSEKYVEGLLESRWDNVVRSTPGIKEDLEGKYPRLSEIISRRIKDDTGTDFSNVFRPGVPDFLAFNDDGEYIFIEVKAGEDGLRNTQLRWLRDFRGINMEIWFSEDQEIDKINETDFSSYGFKDKKKKSDYELIKEGKNIYAPIPDELASITGLEEKDKIKWRLKSTDELILDKR